MDDFLTVGQVADKIGVRPRDVSDAFYSRVLDAARCPVVNGRRFIPTDYVPEVRRVLAERGRFGQAVPA